jgi:hypothetical protein
VTTTLEIATGETEANVPKASNKKSLLDDPAHSSKNLHINNTNNHSQSDIRYDQNRPRIHVGYRHDITTTAPFATPGITHTYQNNDHSTGGSRSGLHSSHHQRH